VRARGVAKWRACRYRSPLVAGGDGGAGVAKLLMIDDSPTVLKIMSMSLVANGYAVRTAASATAGLALARQETPDLIILDINLPDVNGLELLAKLKQDAVLSQVPVLLLSGQDDLERAARGMELGARGFLAKHATSPKVMVQKLREILGK
jgi:DNA-binding response OmpR family regulator